MCGILALQEQKAMTYFIRAIPALTPLGPGWIKNIHPVKKHSGRFFHMGYDELEAAHFVSSIVIGRSLFASFGVSPCSV